MKFSKIVLPGIAMIATSYGLGRFSFGLFLPSISNDLNLNATQAGLISSLFYLAYCFTIIYATLKTDSVGPKLMILFAGLSVLIGLMFTGVTAMLPFLNWRMTYLIYSVIAIIVIIWNYYAIPSLNKELKIETGSFNIRDVSTSKKIIVASTILGFSTAPFWTFSKSFVESIGTYSNVSLSVFWILIGVFGMVGGMSGAMIDRYGLRFAYMIGVIFLSLASIVLAFAYHLWMIPFIASSLFGASYIFITGVLLVWGVKVFLKNASLGIGIPFLMLAVGQVLGSVVAGSLVDQFNYTMTFLIYGLIGMIALFIYPKVNVKPMKVDESEDYTKVQLKNKDVLNIED
ncbi:MFS transporter [Staphylococcus borealis]|nr:MFS transporter [Staphylococcus haemolyticus]